jgi:ribosomal protein S7
MTNNRFNSLLVKHGHVPKKVQADIAKHLKNLGFRNTTNILSLIVEKLAFPLETKKRRRGRNFLNVPFPVDSNRQESLVLHELIKLAQNKKSKNKKSIGERLAFYISETLRSTGPLIKEHNEAINTIKQSRPFA